MKFEKGFKHFCNARHDFKIIQLRKKYGARGYGIFFCVIEMLSNKKNCEMTTDYKAIANELNEDTATVKDIIKNFGLFEIKDKIFCSLSLKKQKFLR